MIDIKSLKLTCRTGCLCDKCQRHAMIFGRCESVSVDNLGPSLEYLLTDDERLGKWIDKYYYSGILMNPESLRSKLYGVLLPYVLFLEEDDEHYLEHYGWSLE